MSYSYMKTYREKRTAERYSLAVEFLGGKCNNCGITNTKFDFDHLNPETKFFELSLHFWDYSWKRIEAELAKCQLLCRHCHIDKTTEEQSVEHGGGASGRKNCKCRLCKDKKNEYMRNYRAGRVK